MATNWRIQSQREEDDLTAEGTFVKAIVVTFEVVPTGTRASVKVPVREYKEERVRELIDAYADSIIRVSQL